MIETHLIILETKDVQVRVNRRLGKAKEQYGEKVQAGTPHVGLFMCFCWGSAARPAIAERRERVYSLLLQVVVSQRLGLYSPQGYGDLGHFISLK